MLMRERLAAALMVCASVPVIAQSPSESAGQISAVMPKASVSRISTNKPIVVDAVKGTPLAWRDTVATGDKGRARIQLNDQSVLSLGPDSRLNIVKHDARSQQTSLVLAYGRIRCQVAKITRSTGSFELRTPSSVAGVIGTDFGADASIPGQTKYVCISGTVRIYTLDRKHYIDCTPGMSVTINSDETPSEATRVSPYVVERWQHVTEPGDEKYEETLERKPDLSDRPPANPDQPTTIRQVDGFPFYASADWRLRVEGWNWFDTTAANPRYVFAHSILHAAVGQNGGKIDWQVQLAQTTLLGAPRDAIAPAPQGQLGLGASYFAANDRSRNAAYVFPSRAFVRIHGVGARESTSLTLGRFTFVDGLEVMPRNPTLAWLKQIRIAHRLIGDFGFSLTGRSADGAAFSTDLGRVNLTLAGARPTRGVFQVNGLGDLDVGWEYGAATVPVLKGRHVGELRVFGAGYQDLRAVTKSDNRPPALLGATDKFQNINIATLGFDYIHAYHSEHAGIFDFLVWAAGQSGSWGVQQHRAGAAALEIGWQPVAKWNPWLRAGYFAGSGDGSPSDNQHNTFFPMLPTPRVYARFPFFNQMNNSDASAMLILRPTKRIKLRSDVHALWLSSRKDLWYLGGGAFDRNTFGFAGRPSGGFRKLANTWDLSADTMLSPHWGLNFYYSHAWTGAVIRSVYPNTNGADFGYTELVLKF